MKVAFVHSRYGSDRPSGENAVVEAEVGALHRMGFQIRLFGTPVPDAVVTTGKRIAAAARVATGWGSSPLEDLRHYGPDILHIHNIFPAHGKRWVENWDGPVLHTVHNYRSLCAGENLMRNGRMCTDCLDGSVLQGLRHRCYKDSLLGTLPLSLAAAGGPMRDPLFRRSDLLLFPSNMTKSIYERMGVPPEKTVVWPPFLPRPLVPSKPAMSMPRWIFVGRLTPEKGLIQLLTAWPNDELLLVVGDGPEIGLARRAAEGKRVEFLGSRTREEVLVLMSRCQGVVVPSVTPETFGLVYLEAMACGVPVVAFTPNNVASMVREEGTGSSLSWGDDLGEALDIVRAGGSSLRAHCREVFESNYSEVGYRTRVLQTYGRLVEG